MRALFIGAHADDVEIGAGGTIQGLVEEGWDVWTTLSQPTPNERIAEAVEAAKEVGASFMPYSSYTGMGTLTTYWDGFSFELIVTTPDTDSHPAHREAAELGIALARKNTIALWQMNHAIPGGVYPAPQLNHFVTWGMEEYYHKMQAIQKHRSQYEKYGRWWIEAIAARDRYYGLMHNRHEATFAEGFRIVKS